MTTTINDKEKLLQMNDFTGILNDGKMSATDIDMFIEYKDVLFILGEGKHIGSQLKFGQELALTRMADSLNKSKPTLLLVYEHDTPYDIIVKDCIVSRYYSSGAWKTPTDIITVGEMVDKFIKKFYVVV